MIRAHFVSEREMVNNGAAAVKHDVCMTPERTTNTTSSRERLNGGNVTFRSTCLRGAADCARGSANLLFSVDLAKEVKYKVEQLFYHPWPSALFTRQNCLLL